MLLGAGLCRAQQAPPDGEGSAAAPPAADRHDAVDADEAPPAAPSPAVDASEPATFTLTIPGTTVAIEFVRLPEAARPPPVDGTGPREPLWVARTELTWDAYDVFVFRLDEPADAPPDGADAVLRPSKPYVLADYGFGHAGWPVISVSSDGALAFCTWLSDKTSLKIRLPSEGEWEALAAVATAGWGAQEDRDALVARAWVKENAERRTHAVGTSARDALGLHDLLGNAGEWCSDGQGGHVQRGGSYLDRSKDVGVASRKVPTPLWNARDPQLPKSRWWLSDASFAGFRVVLEGEPPAPAGALR